MIKKLVIVVAVAGLFLHHAFFYYGHFGGDDMTYAEMARALYRGSPDYGHPFTYRILPLSLLGLSYEAFGINDWASALPALGGTTVVFLLFYWVVRKESAWVLLLTLAAFFSMKWNLFYSDKIMVDVFVSAGVFAAWAAYVVCRRAERDSPPSILGVMAAVSLFLAFCSKGTLILAVPLFTVYCLYDLSRRRWKFWIVLGTVSALLLGLYFAVYQTLTGSALSRFAAIEATHYLNPCSYDVLPLDVLIDRLTTGYLTLLQQSGMLLHGLFALLSLGILMWGKGARHKVLFYPVTVLICLLSINFMTISTHSYNPVCLDPRHILLFGPIISVCSVYSVVALCELFEVRTNGWPFKLAVLIACCVLAYPSFGLALYNRTLDYAKVRDRFERVMQELPRNSTVYGSEVTKMYSRYILGFDEADRGLTFLNIEELPNCESIGKDDLIFLLRSWYTDWHSEIPDITFDTTLTNHGLQRYPSDIRIEGLTVQRLGCAE